MSTTIYTSNGKILINGANSKWYKKIVPSFLYYTLEVDFKNQDYNEISKGYNIAPIRNVDPATGSYYYNGSPSGSSMSMDKGIAEYRWDDSTLTQVKFSISVPSYITFQLPYYVKRVTSGGDEVLYSGVVQNSYGTSIITVQLNS